MTYDLRDGTCADVGRSPCGGRLVDSWSRSGCTLSERCERHWAANEDRLGKVEAGLDDRYPGWRSGCDMPPPADFDPGYAGETW